MNLERAHRIAPLLVVVILAGITLQACTGEDIIAGIKVLMPDLALSNICYYSGAPNPLWVCYQNKSPYELKNAQVTAACVTFTNNGVVGKVVSTTNTMTIGKNTGNCSKINANIQFPNSSLFVPALWLYCGVRYKAQTFTDPNVANNEGAVYVYSSSTGCQTPQAKSGKDLLAGSGWIDEPWPTIVLQQLPAQPWPSPPPAPPPAEQPLQPGPMPPPPLPEMPQESGCAGSPVIPYFTASQTEITVGQVSSLSWGNITNGDTGPLVASAVIEPGLGEVGSGASSRPVEPSQTTTYTLAATGCGGTATRQLTIVVKPAAGAQAPSGGGQSACAGAPVIPYFRANPTSIFSGRSASLSWGNVTNGTSGGLVRSVKIQPGLGEVGSGASSRPVKPTETTTYTLTATGCGGTATRRVTVTVLR